MTCGRSWSSRTQEGLLGPPVPEPVLDLVAHVWAIGEMPLREAAARLPTTPKIRHHEHDARVERRTGQEAHHEGITPPSAPDCSCLAQTFASRDSSHMLEETQRGMRLRWAPVGGSVG